MHGPISLFAEIAPISWHDVAAFATPVFVLAALWWLVSRTDRIMESVFPDLEWERNLSWLNIRAERRASMGMKWVRFGVIVMLVDALVILYWCAKGLPDLSTWADPWVMGDLAWRVPLMGLCLVTWVIYLGLGLLPRVRADRENAAFRKFRKQMAIADEERREMEAMGQKSSRGPTEIPKPRTGPKSTTQVARRHWRQHPPGG